MLPPKIGTMPGPTRIPKLGPHPRHRPGRCYLLARERARTRPNYSPGSRCLRTRRQLGHIGAVVNHARSFALVAASTAGGELNNHTRAVSAHALPNLVVPVGIGRRSLILVTYMFMQGAGLICHVRLFNLSRRGNRNCRVVLFSRYRAGNGDRDDTGIRHAWIPFQVRMYSG